MGIRKSDIKWKMRLVFKWSRFRMGYEIWKPDHLKSEQMGAIFSKTFEIQIWNGPVFKWLGP